jgi:asparaginyl-tRNA synthetase
LTAIRDIYRHTEKYAGQTVTVAGWVRSIRASSHFGFIDLNDGTFFKGIQVVFEEGLSNFEEISGYHTGSALLVSGVLTLTPEAQQPFEIKAQSVALEGASEPEYPLQKKRHGFEYLRTIAHLRPRTNAFSAVFRVRSLTAWAIHRFLQERGFVYVHTPIITGSDCEGAGEMFRVTALDMQNPPRDEHGEVDFSQDFFGRDTNLTVSGQLNAEAYALAFQKVYTFGPTFRAENSNTPRHAAEFWMIEPEIAFADVHDDMDLAEALIKGIIHFVREKAPEEMAFFNKFIEKGMDEKLNNVEGSEFGRITYTEAVDILEKSGRAFQYPVHWGVDLQTEHERFLTEEVFKKPLFVIDYPKDIKAFYMRLNDDGKTVAAMDLLVPGVGEIIGGSQREERYDVLEARLREKGIDPEGYRWYMELRRFGGCRHAGFGLGFERILMYLTGMSNIRDVISYPRTPRQAEF